MAIQDAFEIQDASDIVGEVYARAVVAGPPGSGKSYTALLLGTEIAKAIGSFVGVVETERGKSAFYSARFPHKVIRLTSFEPENYIKAMKAFEQAGCRIIIIDSLSHAWEGTGGVRARVDAAKIRNGGNGFQAWADGTKLQNALMDTIMAYPGYVFACVRTKIEHAQVTENGRTVIKKMGADLVQRGDIEYEFDLALQFDSIAHDATVTKSVLGDYLPVGAMFTCPDATLAHTILRWVEETGGKRAEPVTDDFAFKIEDAEDDVTPNFGPPPDMSLSEFNRALHAMQLDSVEASRMLGIRTNAFHNRNLRADLATIERMIKDERAQAAAEEPPSDPAPVPQASKIVTIPAVAEGDDGKVATAQQTRSIGKLVEALGMTMPEMDSDLTVEQAKAIILTLSQEYQRMRRAS